MSYCKVRRAGSVRFPIGFRTESDWISFAVRSDFVRHPTRFRSVSLVIIQTHISHAVLYCQVRHEGRQNCLA